MPGHQDHHRGQDDPHVVPDEGVALRISAEDALAHGVNPGDPAVVETVVRPSTVQEWIAEGTGRTFSSEEESDFFGRCPVPAPRPAAPAPNGGAKPDEPTATTPRGTR